MHNEQEDKRTEGLISVINKLLFVIVVLVIGIVAMPFILFYYNQPEKKDIATTTEIVKTDTTNCETKIFY